MSVLQTGRSTAVILQPKTTDVIKEEGNVAKQVTKGVFMLLATLTFGALAKGLLGTEGGDSTALSLDTCGLNDGPWVGPIVSEVGGHLAKVTNNAGTALGNLASGKVLPGVKGEDDFVWKDVPETAKWDPNNVNPLVAKRMKDGEYGVYDPAAQTMIFKDSKTYSSYVDDVVNELITVNQHGEYDVHTAILSFEDRSSFFDFIDELRKFSLVSDKLNESVKPRLIADVNKVVNISIDVFEIISKELQQSARFDGAEKYLLGVEEVEYKIDIRSFKEGIKNSFENDGSVLA